LETVYVLIGPTASGKTAISGILAGMLDAEIISADSRQIYKNIPISTCAPETELLKRIKHHFVCEYELNADFNAGLFGTEGRIRIKEIFSGEKKALIVGGSGLYVKSIIDGFFTDETKSGEIRRTLEERLISEGRDVLYKELMKIDPETALKMDSGKFRRVIRALEVYLVSGKRMSELQSISDNIGFKSVQAGLLWDRKELYERINQRVEEMLNNGMVDEIQNIKNSGYHYKTHNSLNTVGIKEVFRYLENELTYTEMKSLIKQNTRRYAKRQMTWFRKDNRINWVNINSKSIPGIISESIYRIFVK
jgi:tRNA dimethylallyltransferase